MYMELVPAYGRDYPTAKAVKEAFNTEQDFEGDYSVRFQILNKQQVPKGTTVNLRYKKLTQIAQVKV